MVRAGAFLILLALATLADGKAPGAVLMIVGGVGMLVAGRVMRRRAERRLDEEGARYLRAPAVGARIRTAEAISWLLVVGALAYRPVERWLLERELRELPTEALIERLYTEDGPEGSRVEAELVRRGAAAVDPLVASIERRGEARAGLFSILERIGEPAVSALAAMLADFPEARSWDERSRLRDRAAGALIRGSDAGHARVCAMLREGKPAARAFAAAALGSVHSFLPWHAKPVPAGRTARSVDALIEALGDPDRDVRGEAVMALAQIGEPSAPAVPALLSELERRNHWAAWALGRIGAEPERAVPALMEGARAWDPHFATECVEALGAYGPAAEQALPLLRRLLEYGAEDVARAARLAIHAISGRWESPG